MRLVKDTFWNGKPAKIQAGAIIAAIIILAFIPGFTNTAVPLFLSWTMAYCVLSVSWSFFSGKAGYISLATASFYGIGMYLQAILGRQFPLWATMLFAAALAFIVGIIIGVVTLRLRGIYFTIFTFGLSLFLNRFMNWYEGAFTRTKGRMVKPYDNDTVFYALLIIFAITIIAVLILNKSKFGLSLKCIGQNEDSAQHLGVRTTLVKVLAFAITAAPVGAAGAVTSIKIGYIDPNTAFGLNTSFFPVLMAIFGGMSSTYGPLIGAVIFYALQDYLLHETNLHMVIFGAVMVIIIMIMPNGLIGTIEEFTGKKRKGVSLFKQLIFLGAGVILWAGQILANIYAGGVLSVSVLPSFGLDGVHNAGLFIGQYIAGIIGTILLIIGIVGINRTDGTRASARSAIRRLARKGG